MVYRPQRSLWIPEHLGVGVYKPSDVNKYKRYLDRFRQAVAFSSVANVTPATGTSFTITITTPAANPVILVGVALDSATATVSSITSDKTSSSITEVKNVRLTASFASVWVVVAPEASVSTVLTVNLSASVAYQGAAETFSGTDQTTPSPTGDAVSGMGTAVSSITVTPSNLTANDASFGCGVNTVGGDAAGISTNDRYKNSTTSVNTQIGDSSGATALVANWNFPTGAVQVAIGVRIVVAGAAAAKQANPPVLVKQAIHRGSFY